MTAAGAANTPIHAWAGSAHPQLDLSEPADKLHTACKYRRAGQHLRGLAGLSPTPALVCPGGAHCLWPLSTPATPACLLSGGAKLPWFVGGLLPGVPAVWVPYVGLKPLPALRVACRWSGRGLSPESLYLHTETGLGIFCGVFLCGYFCVGVQPP